MSMEGRLESPADALNFALAGSARITLRSTRSDARFTYKIAKCKDRDGLWFVSVLSGPDNCTNYQYFGTIRIGSMPSGAVVPNFSHGRKSKIGADAPSVAAFAWFWRHLVERGAIPPALEVWHEGHCGRCGRLLTVPASIARGIGPDCAQMMCEAA